MGCDIHAYVDFKSFKKDNCDWYIKNLAQIRLGRDYLLFSYLADVRNYNNITPISPPKDIPKNNSYIVEHDYTLFVLDDAETINESGYCSKKQAEEYVKYGSKWYDENRVTHPDWHSVSWLTVEELKKVQQEYSKNMALPDVNIIKPNEKIPDGYKKVMFIMAQVLL